MALVGTKRASELTGKSKSTIQRAMDKGVLSFELDRNDRRVIDVSELERVFGLVAPSSQKQSSSASQSGGADGGGDSSSTANLSHQDVLEMERMKIRVKMLEDKLDLMETQIDDMRSQRDQWQKQAQQVLLTSQYSQRQAEEYKAEIRERDRRVEAKRQQILKERMGQSGGYNDTKKKVTSAAPVEGNAGKKSGPSNGPSQTSSGHSGNLPTDNIEGSKIKSKIKGKTKGKIGGKTNGDGSVSSSGSASRAAGSSSSSSSSSTGQVISQNTNSANESAPAGARSSIWNRLKKHVSPNAA